MVVNLLNAVSSSANLNIVPMWCVLCNKDTGKFSDGGFNSTDKITEYDQIFKWNEDVCKGEHPSVYPVIVSHSLSKPFLGQVNRVLREVVGCGT